MQTVMNSFSSVCRSFVETFSPSDATVEKVQTYAPPLIASLGTMAVYANSIGASFVAPAVVAFGAVAFFAVRLIMQYRVALLDSAKKLALGDLDEEIKKRLDQLNATKDEAVTALRSQVETLKKELSALHEQKSKDANESMATAVAIHLDTLAAAIASGKGELGREVQTHLAALTATIESGKGQLGTEVRTHLTTLTAAIESGKGELGTEVKNHLAALALAAKSSQGSSKT